MLLTKTVTESNRDLLRILMTALYTSSAKARTIHADIEAYTSGSSARKDFHFLQAWNKVAPPPLTGPFPSEALQKIQKQADGDYARMLTDSKGRFFSHLMEYVQHLKHVSQKGNHSITHPLQKQFAFSQLPVTDEFSQLGEVIKTHYTSLLHDLRDEGIRQLILAEYGPQIVPAVVEPASKVVPIRPGITFLNPLPESGPDPKKPAPERNLG